MRHLTHEQALNAVTAGRTIEQWLGFVESSEGRFLRWLSVARVADGGVRATLFESFDVGTPDLVDVYEFPPVDPDEPFGVTYSFDDAAVAS